MGSQMECVQGVSNSNTELNGTSELSDVELSEVDCTFVSYPFNIVD